MMRMIPGLIAVGALIGACDDGNGGSDIEFRRGDGECIGTGIVVSTSPTAKAGTMPNPMDPDKILDLTEDHMSRVEDNVLWGMSTAFVANDENAATCAAACDEKELKWGGNGCVYDGDITLGDGVPLEATKDHPAMMMFAVDGTAEMGCLCQ